MLTRWITSLWKNFRRKKDDRTCRFLTAIRMHEPNAYMVPLHETLWPASFGALYTTLGHLEKLGLITTEFSAGGPERSYRRKTVYFLTEKGRAFLEDKGQ